MIAGDISSCGETASISLRGPFPSPSPMTWGLTLQCACPSLLPETRHLTTTQCGSATLYHCLYALLHSFVLSIENLLFQTWLWSSGFEAGMRTTRAQICLCRRQPFEHLTHLTKMSFYLTLEVNWSSLLSFFIGCCDPDRMRMGCDNCCQGWRPQMLYTEGAIVPFLIFFVCLPLLLCSTQENVNVLAWKRSWV